jgi:hypothetical protein
MKTLSSITETKTRRVKDYISVIKNAEELFELYNANIHLEILKRELFKKRGSNYNDATITAEINLACELQDLCKRRV